MLLSFGQYVLLPYGFDLQDKHLSTEPNQQRMCYFDRANLSTTLVRACMLEALVANALMLLCCGDFTLI